jgi:hypothetical protein
MGGGRDKECEEEGRGRSGGRRNTSAGPSPPCRRQHRARSAGEELRITWEGREDLEADATGASTSRGGNTT